MTVVVVIVVIAVVAVIAVVVVRARRPDDGVEGFRRHIDALSSDARRPTIDRGLGDDDAGRATGGPVGGIVGGIVDERGTAGAGGDDTIAGEPGPADAGGDDDDTSGGTGRTGGADGA